MEPATSEPQRVSRGRVNDALRKRHNWEQLLKFCVVGASGYAVNLAVYTLLSKWRISTTARGGRLVRRRGDEQLHAEPALDVPRRARPRRYPGAALP